MAADEPWLEGKMVRLRPFGAADVDSDYLAWLNDPETTRYSNQRFRTHDARSGAAYLASFADTANLFISVRALEDDRALGTMTAYLNPHHGTADLGILIGDGSVRGQGYGQEAWNLLLAWLLARPGIRKVTCGTSADNRAMIRVAERAGMEPDGVRRAQELVDGVPVDIIHYARFSPF